MLEVIAKATGSFLLACTIGLAAGSGHANDPAPTTEQVTERTQGLRAVLSALQSNVTRLRFGLEESLLSSGRFSGAQARWFRSELSVEGAASVLSGAVQPVQALWGSFPS